MWINGVGVLYCVAYCTINSLLITVFFPVVQIICGIIGVNMSACVNCTVGEWVEVKQF